MVYRSKGFIGAIVLIVSLLISCTGEEEGKIQVHNQDHIVLIGNNLASRMMNFGHFETELQLRYPDSTLFIRNMGDGGNTPGFRPHSARNSPWAFPGAEKFAKFLADKIFGTDEAVAEANRKAVHDAVLDKNWFWHNDFKIPNGVHAYGRRYDPFGPANYPYEIEKIRQMTANRDTAIWNAAAGTSTDLVAMDAKTKKLPPVKTNYKEVDGSGDPKYLYGQDALDKIEVPNGYKLELFASEEEFEDLANPVQLLSLIHI